MTSTTSRIWTERATRRSRPTRVAGIAVAGAVTAVATVAGASGAGAQPSPTPPTTPAGTAVATLRQAAAARGVAASEAQLLELARRLGSADAARAFLVSTPQQLAAATEIVINPTAGSSVAVAALAANCSSRSDRYSKRVSGIEFQYHVMQTAWCWDPNGNVTTVSGIRTSYGTTFAGQLQGYRWVAEPTVQQQNTYVAHSYTDKNGTHNSIKGRTRITGHWAVCLTGPLDWLCPVEADGHTVVDVGYGATSSPSSYDS